jgi:hypothetical protein
MVFKTIFNNIAVISGNFLINELSLVLKGVIISRKSKDRHHNGQKENRTKEKQQSTKHFTEN